MSTNATFRLHGKIELLIRGEVNHVSIYCTVYISMGRTEIQERKTERDTEEKCRMTVEEKGQKREGQNDSYATHS
jgi:hypothetical protein